MSLDFNRLLAGINEPVKKARRDPCDRLDEHNADPIFQPRPTAQQFRFEPHPIDDFNPVAGDGE